MKKIGLALVLVALWIAPSLAETYSSPLGFSVNLPPNWKVVNAQKMRSNPQLLNTAFAEAQKESLQDADHDMMADLKTRVQQGEIEYFYNPGQAGSLIAVMQRVGQIPETGRQLIQACDSLPNDMVRMFGKSLRVYACDLRPLGNRVALYIVTDGVAPGTKSMQYELQKTPDQILIFTANARDGNFHAVSSEFDQIMNHVTLQQ